MSPLYDGSYLPRVVEQRLRDAREQKRSLVVRRFDDAAIIYATRQGLLPVGVYRDHSKSRFKRVMSLVEAQWAMKGRRA